MTALVPIMMFSWVPFTVFLFFRLVPHRAVLVSIIGGWLLLPVIAYNLPGIPPYTKAAAISLGLILGGRLSGQRRKADFKWRRYDLPMVMWCLCPIATSLSNQLGLYDGLSGVYEQIMTWGIPYLSGRIYFRNHEALRDLCMGLVFGGLLYLPLCLYEIRMSPQLSNFFYGFFPHSFFQHIRYGAYRPIVFMQHGLMVSLWMALTTTTAFWLWRSGTVKEINGIPIALITVALAATTILCKSANGWAMLAVGCGSFLIYNKTHSVFLFRFFLLLFTCYLALRISGLVKGYEVSVLAGKVFDAQRVESLGVRLQQEELFALKALRRPFFGWGGYGRAWPVDPVTGQMSVQMIDSLWLVTFSNKGFVGLISLCAGMLTGPWLTIRYVQKQCAGSRFSPIGSLVLSLLVILFMIDCLVNGMTNPVYILVSGALVGGYVNQASEG